MVYNQVLSYYEIKELDNLQTELPYTLIKPNILPKIHYWCLFDVN